VDCRQTAVISSTNWGGFTRKRVMSVGIGEALLVAPAFFNGTE
jgi:hypothetical protein